MDRQVRDCALRALASGAVTFDEAVKLAGVARSTVFRWCRAAGVDWREARSRRAWREWEKAAGGRRRRRKPTKAEQHRQADAAKVAWDLSHEQDGLA
jgi:hypothetical protein